MSGTDIADTTEKDLADSTSKEQVDLSVEDQKQLDNDDENPMSSPDQEEEMIKKKYGGMLPRKPPLISKDHERAFFDSADWALGKQGAQKPKGPLEALRPKLQPTHQQVRLRRSAYAPAHDAEDGGIDNNMTSEDQGSSLDGGESDNTSENQSSESKLLVSETE